MAIGALAFVEDADCKAQHIVSVGEEAGVPRDASQGEAVLVLHFALDHAMAKRGVVLGWRHPVSQERRRVKAGSFQLQKSSNFTLEHYCQRLAGENFESTAKQHESDVRILGSRAGRGFERKMQKRVQHRLRRTVLLEQAGIAGQT